MTPPANSNAEPLKHFAAWLAALFLIVLGAKLWVVQLYGSPLPLWDQWFEADVFFRPWLEGHLSAAVLLAPNNEHRIVFTHLLDMAIIRLNGRWEPMLQMAVNAFIHATFVCALAFCFWNFLGRKKGWLVCAALVPFFALPYGAENILWAINSQQYFMSLFALGTLVGLGFSPAGSGRWWLGLAFAVMSLFTMASGLLAAAAAGGLLVLRALKTRKIEKGTFVTLVVCLGIIALGAALTVTLPGDQPLRAHTLRQFVTAGIHNLSWPFINAPAMALVISLPLVGLLVAYFRKNFAATRAAEFIFVLALWSVLQSAAIAYGRANYGEGIPASRYMDVLNMLVIASLFATGLLAALWPAGKISRQFAPLLPIVFVGVICFGLAQVSQMVVDYLLVPTRMMNLVAEERVATYLATGNEQELLEKPTVRPDPKLTRSLLANARLQTILPAECLAPTPQPVVGRFSAAARWPLEHSPVILMAGFTLFAGLCAFGLARRKLSSDLAGVLVLLTALGALGFVWSKSPLQRYTIERQLHSQLSKLFKNVPCLTHERMSPWLSSFRCSVFPAGGAGRREVGA